MSDYVFQVSRRCYSTAREQFSSQQTRDISLIFFMFRADKPERGKHDGRDDFHFETNVLLTNGPGHRERRALLKLEQYFSIVQDSGQINAHI